jgi:hypothetical protein
VTSCFVYILEELTDKHWVMAINANIRQVCKGLQSANTLAYCDLPLITTIKSFIALVPGKTFGPKFDWETITVGFLATISSPSWAGLVSLGVAL